MIKTRLSTVVDTRASGNAALRPVPIDAVTIGDGFWAEKRRLVREVSIPEQYRQIASTGRLENFKRVAGKSDQKFNGIFFNDSDVYKWLEAASWSLADNPDPALDKLCDEVIATVGAAQDDDGYLDTYFSCERKGERCTNLRDMHELYCAGHFLQAAIAHRRATGKQTAFDIAVRLADCICNVFGSGAGQLRLVDGHEEIEMALVELARETGDERYLRQAEFFVDVRGEGVIGGAEYYQDHVPIRRMSEIVGHAVRALYYACGAADIALETGDADLTAALDRLWTNMTDRRMYLSGGLGARWEGESFGVDYELPNERAYAETCAAIASVMWNWRMLLMHGDARYADLIEHTLYNGVLPGISLDATEYFYQNPLADSGKHRRQAWFGCACCPPNIARMLMSLPGYFYTTAPGEIWIHQYASGTARLEVDGRTIALRQDGNYPWDGEIRIAVDEADAGEWALRVRIPAWAEGASAQINGKPIEGVRAGEYLTIRRVWTRGDSVRLSLPMEARWLSAHPYVLENRGRTALMIGPLLYCFEGVDNGDMDLIMASRDTADDGAEVRFDKSLLGGVNTARVRMLDADLPAAWQKRLYGPPVAEERPSEVRDALAVPYFAWANRQPGRMQIWMLGHQAV